MTIREATAADLDRCVAMGSRFLNETCYRGRIVDNPSQMRETAGLLVSSAAGALFVAEDDAALVGMIGVLAYTHPLSGQSIAAELFWWVNVEHRGGPAAIRLLRRAERWARESGAVALQMVAPAGGNVGRLYQRCGYQELETAWSLNLARAENSSELHPHDLELGDTATPLMVV